MRFYSLGGYHYICTTKLTHDYEHYETTIVDCFLSFIYHCSDCFSQSDERFFSKYNYHYITESEGVPHSFIDDILCDSEGFIWMATHNGIGRYDGYQVMSINTQTQPLKLKMILCMHFVRIIFVGCGSDLREDLKPLI